MERTGRLQQPVAMAPPGGWRLVVLQGMSCTKKYTTGFNGIARPLSVSDDDICAKCEHLRYRPGRLSRCALRWPGNFDGDGYCVSCPSFSSSAVPTANMADASNTQTKEQRATALQAALMHFHGSDSFTRFNHITCPKVYASEGAMHVAREAGAFWLLEFIGLRCDSKEFPKIKAEEFQVWKLAVDLEASSAVMTCEDGNYNEVFREVIEHTSFPLEKLDLWCEPNEFGRTIYLPSER